MKKLIGLTGLSGSGKSAAAEYFEKLGCACFDCDAIAHRALFDKDIKKQITDFFGDGVLCGGEIDRRALGAIVFSDKEKLAVLNKIIHPYVVNVISELYQKSDREICIADGSEIESSGLYKKCDAVIVIEATKETRLERIMRRDGISAQRALSRINAQTPYSKKAIHILNEHGLKELYAELDKAYAYITGVKNE